MKCPRCQGSLLNNYGEVKCISCGYITVENDELTELLDTMANSLPTTAQAAIHRRPYPIVRDDDYALAPDP